VTDEEDPPHHICDACMMFGPPPMPYEEDIPFAETSPNPTALTAAPEEE